MTENKNDELLNKKDPVNDQSDKLKLEAKDFKESKKNPFREKIRKITETFINKSKEILATISIITILSTGIVTVRNVAMVPGSYFETSVPLVVGDTMMRVCTLKNFGLSTEQDVWVTLRTKPEEIYEISFTGAEGFAKVLQVDSIEQSVVENEVISAKGTTRLVIERLSKGQAVNVVVKSLPSTVVTCEIIGASGATHIPESRVLVISNYAILILIFLFTSFFTIIILELIRFVGRKMS